MSLINQMLKDLEQRRAQELGMPSTLLQGVNRYRIAQHCDDRRPWLMLALFLPLLLALGALLWERYRPVSTSWVTPNSSTTRLSPPIAPPVPLRLAEQQAAQAPKPTKDQSDTPVASGAASVQPTTLPKLPLKMNTVHLAAADAVVEKRTRALTAEQKAEKIYQQAYLLMAQGKERDARVLLRQALQQQARHFRARELLASSYIKGGRYVEATELLQQGRKLQPQHWLFTQLYARVLLQQQQLDAAVSALNDAPPSVSQDPQYHALLAALYQRQGDHHSAAKTYQELLQRYPREGVWWVGLGISQEQLGQQEQATLAYNKAAQSGSLSSRLRSFASDRLNNLPQLSEPAE